MVKLVINTLWILFSSQLLRVVSYTFFFDLNCLRNLLIHIIRQDQYIDRMVTRKENKLF